MDADSDNESMMVASPGGWKKAQRDKQVLPTRQRQADSQTLFRSERTRRTFADLLAANGLATFYSLEQVTRMEHFDDGKRNRVIEYSQAARDRGRRACDLDENFHKTERSWQAFRPGSIYAAAAGYFGASDGSKYAPGKSARNVGNSFQQRVQCEAQDQVPQEIKQESPLRPLELPGCTRYPPLGMSYLAAPALSHACGEFVLQFSKGFITIETPGDEWWCLLFAVHRGLILIYWDRAPTLAQIFKAYVKMGKEGQWFEDMEARHRRRFRIDQAGLFVSQLTRRLFGESVQIGQYRRRVPNGHSFATLFDCGLQQAEKPNHYLWIMVHEGDIGHYETISRPDIHLRQEQLDIFNKKISEEDGETARTILYLDHQLRIRGLDMTALCDPGIAEYIAGLKGLDEEMRDGFVLQRMGPVDLSMDRDMRAAEALAELDELSDGIDYSGEWGLGNDESPRASSNPRSAHRSTTNDGNDREKAPEDANSDEENKAHSEEDPNDSNEDTEWVKESSSAEGSSSDSDDGDDNPDGVPNLPPGCVMPAGRVTDQGVKVWRGVGHEGRPLYLPQNLNAERYTIVDTRYGSRAVPTQILGMSGVEKAFMPDCVRLYLRSLSEARVLNAPQEVLEEIRALMNTFNWGIIANGQPLFRRWTKRRGVTLSIALNAVTNGQGSASNMVNEYLNQEGLKDLTYLDTTLSFGNQGTLIIEETGQIVCEPLGWQVENFHSHLRRDSARKLPDREERFRQRQTEYLNRNVDDPRILYRQIGRVDQYGRPVARVFGELFSEDTEAQELDRDRGPLTVFTRNEDQRAFAREMGCSMNHEPESRTRSRTPPPLQPDDERAEIPGRRQVLNGIRLLVHRVIECCSKRLGRAVSSEGLVREITEEVQAMEDYYETADSEDGLRGVDGAFFYFFVENHDCGRAFNFLRTRIHEYLERHDGIKTTAELKNAIERDLNFLGRKHLKLGEIDARGASRKYGQGQNPEASRGDVAEFLREKPDPIPYSLRGRRSGPARNMMESRTAHQVSPPQSGRPAKAPRRLPKKDNAGQDSDMMRTLSQILGGSIREGEDLVAAARRLVQNERDPRAPYSGHEPRFELIGDDDGVKSEHADGDRAEEANDSPAKEPGSDDGVV